jgi:hypothetical protein
MASRVHLIRVSDEVHDAARVASALGCESIANYMDRCLLPLIRQHIREHAALIATHGLQAREHRRPFRIPAHRK